MILLVIIEVDSVPHKYGYVHGDPIQGVDPTGMFLGTAISVTVGFARTAVKSSVAVTTLSAVSGAGVYYFAFDDSPIKGAVVGTQIGAALSVSWNRGITPQKRQQNLLGTVGQGFVGGLSRVVSKLALHIYEKQFQPGLDAPTNTKITQYFVEGFSDAVWAYEFSNYLDDWTGVDPDEQLIVQLVHSFAKSAIAESIKIVEDGEVSWDEVVDGTKDALLGTVTGFTTSRFVGQALKTDDPLARAAFTTLVTSGINIGIDAGVEILDSVRKIAEANRR